MNYRFNKILAFVLAMIFVFILCSCTKKDTEEEKEYIQLDDVSYGSEKIQKLDMVMPLGSKANGGLIVYIHGGAWTDGGKGEGGDYMYNYYSEGYVFASIDYRFISETVDMDDLMDDVTSTLKCIVRKSGEYGIGLKKAMLTGMSAGGQMAELYAYSKRDASPVEITCCAGLSAVSDMSAESLYIDNPLDIYNRKKMVEISSQACGFEFTADTLDEAKPYLDKISPVAYASTAVPTVIAHGMADDIIEYQIALDLYNALQENGIVNSFITFPNSGHTLESDKLQKLQMNREILKYAEEYLK